ncbi:glycosyltransferase family 4 protein [Mariniflexile sp.]|uniref:glycosyltransferase family 4 protein n=1 Tax=Mariniflexile sp. TaxID=1979402 RepID=UPI003569463C
MKQAKTKIVFTSENRTWGGSELLWSATAKILAQKIEVHVLVYEDLNLPDWLMRFEHFYLHRIKSPKLRIVNNILNRFLPYKYRLIPKDKRLIKIKELQPDLLVINQGFNFNGVKLMSFAKFKRINYVTVSHAVNEAFWPNLKLRRDMRDGFRGSLSNFFVSKDNLEVTEAQIGVILDNSEIVRNPFNVPYAVDIDYPKHNNYHLACVGRFDFNAKGQDVLLRVLSQEKWKNRNLIVNFYGNGNDIENLKDLIELFSIKNVVIHPYTDTIEIWKKNQGLLLTSRYEGLPIALVEAMLCKRLVILTNVSGNAELVMDNLTGFIAAAPRPEYVDEALERAWVKRENWKHLGEEARKYIVTEVTEQPDVVFANKLLSLINKK